MAHPILARLGEIIGLRRPVVGAIITRIAGQPLAAGTPVANAVSAAAVAAAPSGSVAGMVAPMAVTAVMNSIANNNDVTLTEIKPMSRSVEGWSAVGGALVVLINQLGPSLGITVSQPISDAVEVVTSWIGLPVGSGQAAVALVTVGAFAFVWIRKKFFTHTVTPAAADRAIANGTAV